MLQNYSIFNLQNFVQHQGKKKYLDIPGIDKSSQNTECHKSLNKTLLQNSFFSTVVWHYKKNAHIRKALWWEGNLQNIKKLDH